MRIIDACKSTTSMYWVILVWPLYGNFCPTHLRNLSISAIVTCKVRKTSKQMSLVRLSNIWFAPVQSFATLLQCQICRCLKTNNNSLTWIVNNSGKWKRLCWRPLVWDKSSCCTTNSVSRLFKYKGYKVSSSTLGMHVVIKKLTFLNKFGTKLTFGKSHSQWCGQLCFGGGGGIPEYYPVFL